MPQKTKPRLVGGRSRWGRLIRIDPTSLLDAESRTPSMRTAICSLHAAAGWWPSRSTSVRCAQQARPFQSPTTSCRMQSLAAPCSPCRRGERSSTRQVQRPPARASCGSIASGKEVATLGEPGFYTWPRLSPDGQRVAVTATDPATGNADIWIYAVRDRTRLQLTFDAAQDGNPAWAPDGTRIYFTSVRRGFRNIYSMDSRGSETETVSD